MPSVSRSLAGLAITVLALSSLEPSSNAGAQQLDSTRLQTVVVTATRRPTPISATSQPVTVLSGADLRARGVTSVADALRSVPATSVTQSGSFGGVTSLFLRGGESRYTKVLVDGVPVNAVGGTVFLQNLTLDNVDRIEIVGGPSSALYGADAMTGVIQIFTRAGSERGADLSVDGGTYGTGDASASVRMGSRVADVSFGGGWHQTEGVDAFDNRYRNGTLSAALSMRPDPGTTIALTSRYVGSTYHFPTDYAGVISDTSASTREGRVLLGLDAAHVASDWLTIRLLGGYTELHGRSDDRHAFGSSDRSSDVRGTGEARAELSLLGATRVTIGLPYESDAETIRSVGLAPGSVPTATHDHREVRGAYVAAQGAPASWLAYDASARYDSHSDFRSIATYHAGASFGLWPGGRLRAAYGTGFNAPAFYETLGSVYNRPNRDLQPEQAHTVDVGAEQSLLSGRVHLRAGAFDQRFSQIIQYVAGASYTDPGIYRNLTAARALGYTGAVSLLPVTGLDVGASYTQTIARVTSVPAGSSTHVGDALLRRPSHSADAHASYGEKGWMLGAVLNYVGARPDVDFQRFSTVQLPAYTTLDLSGALPIAQRNATTIALTVRVANALDRRYEEIANFPAPGRTLLVGARLTAHP